MDVVAWLRTSGFGQYAASFAENKIDAGVLRQLTSEDLKELGVSALGDRKKLLAAIATLGQSEGTFLGGESSTAASARTNPSLTHTPQHLAARILDGRSALEGERKRVTVLFADIKGSTELIEKLDPEEAARRLGPPISLMMGAVHQYEGTVNQMRGDGIMALFGAPLAHEDHAVRACLSALAMRDAIARAKAQGVELRIGLHSGEVLVRAIHNDLSMDYNAIGATVHLASRMEQMARTGCIYLTAATNALARGIVETRPLGLTAVKGMSRDVEVFELLHRAEAHTRWEARSAHQLTALVGRTGELDMLLTAARCVLSGQGQLVTFTGEAGMGKSRLAHEFLRMSQMSDWSLYQTGASPYGVSDPFLPIAILFRSMFSIKDHDSEADICAKVRDTLPRQSQQDADLLPAIQFLLNLSIQDPAWEKLDPQQRRNKVVEDLRNFVLRSTVERPLLLLVEDLHWIDPETQRFLDTLANSLAAHRILLLVTYRPEYQHSWSSKSYYTPIRVNPLAETNAREMLDALLGTGPGLAALKTVLIERTQGRPLFIEELVRSLRESGVIVGPSYALRVEGNLDHMNVPGAVQDVLASRIDRLAPELKRLLQTASVIGRSVPLRLLERIVESPIGALGGQLANLQDAEFLYEWRGGSDVGFQFKHALTEEVAYASLTQDRRRYLHGRVVDAIEEVYADRLADHYEGAGRHAFRAERWEKAFVYSRLAAKKAHARSTYQSAIGWFEQTLTALEKSPEANARVSDMMDVRLEMRTALWPLGRHDELEQRVREAGELAERVGDVGRLANVHNYLTAHYWRSGEHDKAVKFGERGIALAEEANDFSIRVTTMQHLGLALMARGEFVRQTTLHREVAQLLTGEQARHRHGMAGYPAAITRGFLAWGLAELGEFDEAFKWAREGVAIAHEVNSAMSRVWVTDYLAFIHLLRGDADQALELMRINFELCQKAEVRLLFSLTAGILGYAFTQKGLAEEGLQLLEQAMHPSRLQHHPQGSGYPMVWQALAHLNARDPADALSHAQRALQVAIRQGERGHQAWALFAQGEIVAPMADGAQQADLIYREALTIAEQCGMQTLATHCRSRLGGSRTHLISGS